MTLPSRHETREHRECIDDMRKSLRRARDLLKKLKISAPVNGDEDLRQVVRKSARQVKKAIEKAAELEKAWLDRVERPTDS
jgi:hypothetical protein